MMIKWRMLCLTVLLGTAWHANAGGTRGTINDPEALARRAEFSKYVEKNLAMRRVEVAIVGRVGRPEQQLPPGVRFTHVGIAVYSNVTG